MHTEVSKQNSTKRCDMLRMGSEQDLQMHVKNLTGSPKNKSGS